MIGKASGVVGREGARRNGFARLASVAVVGVVGLGVVGGLCACSSDPATKPAAMSTPVTPTDSWLSASKGQVLGDPKNQLARLCRTTGTDGRAVDPTYCGA